MRGIYVHIPFCKQKCYYCDFVSFANKEEIIEQYINALKKEINNTLKPNDKIDTIYIGGGTPSVIDSKYIIEVLQEIYNIVGFDKTREVTIEINPGTLTEKKLENYKKAKINRISLGLQATQDRLLKSIGRIHNYDQFKEAYNLVNKADFTNVNIDLMLGLPNQSLKDLEESLNEVIALKPTHISIYSLILEEGTKLEELINKKVLELPTEDLERQMYWKTKNILEENGYIHYEISNFARKGYESRHNSNCWKQQEYYGFGVSAHSYINNIRYSNTENLEEYIEYIGNDEYNKIKETHEIQTKISKAKEYMMLKLRTIEGVKIQEYKEKFQEDPLFLYRKEIEKLTKQDLIEVDLDNIKLTKKGLDFANEVWEEFV